MSRTYRLRHLPRRRSWKFIDASISHKRFRNKIEEDLEQQLKEIGFERWAAWHIAWDICRNDPKYFTPVGSKGDHPWVSWWWVNGAKTYYRSKGNQLARRRNRMIINKFGELLDDEWIGHWPDSRRDRLNKWDLD
jgi:hypothetical protein